MDIMSSVAGNPEYVSSIEFAPVSARYLRIAATGGDNFYSVGEFQAFGSTSVPVPATALLFGLGLIGLVGSRKTKSKRA